MNLYRVKLKGMKSAVLGISYGDSFVVANDPTEAYQKIREYLDNEDIGFMSDRVLETIEFLASEDPRCKRGIFLRGVPCQV